MSRSTSKSAAPRYGRGRKIPDFMLARMARYYNIHGWQKTQEKYRVSSSTMQRVVKNKWVHKGENGSGPLRAVAKPSHSLYLLAKKLEHAVQEHRRAGNPPSDLESYAIWIVREILK